MQQLNESDMSLISGGATCGYGAYALHQSDSCGNGGVGGSRWNVSTTTGVEQLICDGQYIVAGAKLFA